MNRWTVVHTRILEGIVKDALDGTGMNPGEVLYLNVDGSSLLNAIVPVHGNSVASSAVHGGGGGRFFGKLKFTSKPPDHVVGFMPLMITELLIIVDQSTSVPVSLRCCEPFDST